MEYSIIRENLKEVEQNIVQACVKSNRSREEVTLIAVSKTKPVEALMEAYRAGCRDFGENKVQELMEKYEVMPKDIRWHMIGHLQRNKVKYLVGKVNLIHSVDSLRLAEEIDKEAQKKGLVVPVLVEVNVADEKTKFGTSYEDAVKLIEEIGSLTNVKVKGLMGIAPYVEKMEENRQYFVNLKKISVDIMQETIDNNTVSENKVQKDNLSMNILSMGMTGDYPVAIEEGATMVRVGTGIFGERQYAVLE